MFRAGHTCSFHQLLGIKLIEQMAFSMVSFLASFVTLTLSFFGNFAPLSQVNPYCLAVSYSIMIVFMYFTVKVFLINRRVQKEV